MERWPNFFIVGAPRAGSSSLFEYLKDIKGIYMAPNKDPNHFSVNVDPDLLILRVYRDKKEYLKLFDRVTDEKAIGDATPTYLWDPDAPKLIHDVVPDAKIIIMLRDPLQRAYSHFLKLVSSGTDQFPFIDSIKRAVKAPPDFSGRVVDAGMYYEQVKRYLEIFPREQIKIFVFEEFVKEPKKVVKEILDFIGIDEPVPESVGQVHNPYREPRGKLAEKIVRSDTIRNTGKKFLPRTAGLYLKVIFGKTAKKPPMPEDAKKMLDDIYREDVRKLQELIGRQLPWDIAKQS